MKELLVCLLVAALASLHCAGIAGQCSLDPRTDAPHEMPLLSPPAVGESYRSCYGREVVRLTDRTKEGAAFIHAEYATQNHVSADGAIVKVQLPDGTVRLMRRATRAWLPGISLHASQNPVWHPREPNLLLYVDGARILRLDPTTGKSSEEGSAAPYESLETGGEADISPDGKKLVFLARKGSARHVVVFHRDQHRLSADRLDVTGRSINWVQVTNTRVLVAFNLDPTSCDSDVAAAERFWEADGQGAPRLVGCQPLRIFDTEMRPAWPDGRTLLAPYWGHGDVGLDATDGDREVWVMANSFLPVPNPAWFPEAAALGPAGCSNSLVRFTLDRPRPPTCLRAGDPAFSWDQALHVALPAVPSPWAYVTFYRTQGDSQYQPLPPPTPTLPCAACTVPFQNEIVRIRLDGSGFERLAHHHSSRYLPSSGHGAYNWQPRSSVDAQGRFLLFNSNFGEGSSDVATDVYALTLPGGR